ncbi:MAG: D-aminopeptidase DppA [Bacteroidia bacterium]|nr:MAG: D-aminopeptidase DppA [Bacteroidia bacterium]
MKLIVAALIVLASLCPGQVKLKVLISVDMEGVSGVVSGDQLSPEGFEYQRFREFMTAEALAAVRAAKEAGATEILVVDAHGNGQNLLIDRFPNDVRIIRSWPRRFGMMAGIDETFDAVLFIGYHSSTNNSRGVRAHTFSSARLTGVRLNGKIMTEGSWNAAIAGHFGVPVVMISGDDAVLKEVRDEIGPIEGAEVKRSLGFHSANTMTPEAAGALIATAVKKGLARRGDLKPYVVKTPVTLEVTFKNYLVSEVLAYLRGVERVDPHTIRYIGKDMTEVADFMVFLTNYSLSLEP